MVSGDAIVCVNVTKKGRNLVGVSDNCRKDKAYILLIVLFK